MMTDGVFFDCGAHIGQSIKEFKKTELYKSCDWNIHAFEPHPELVDNMLHTDDADVEVHQTAVWIQNGTTKFYLTKSLSNYHGVEEVPWGSSTVVEEKKSGNLDKDEPIIVECIDLAEFIRHHTTNKKTVILKMDIEGAEYKVLKHLIETEVINQVDILLVEFHYGKISGLRQNFRHWLLRYHLWRHNVLIIEEQENQKSGQWFQNARFSRSLCNND